MEMNLKNATVLLTYSVRGMMTHPGDYIYKERTTSGSPLEEEQRLFTHKEPEYSDCHKKAYLNEAFVNYAISDEGRPKQSVDNRAYTFWRKMSQMQRLEWHIAKYVSDLGGKDYSFNIMEE